MNWPLGRDADREHAGAWIAIALVGAAFLWVAYLLDAASRAVLP
jgi:hypothetical protein